MSIQKLNGPNNDLVYFGARNTTNELEVNKRKRYCKNKTCKKKLSMYNLNKWCFACLPEAIANENKRKDQSIVYIHKGRERSCKMDPEPVPGEDRFNKGER